MIFFSFASASSRSTWLAMIRRSIPLYLPLTDIQKSTAEFPSMNCSTTRASKRYDFNFSAASLKSITQVTCISRFEKLRSKRRSTLGLSSTISNEIFSPDCSERFFLTPSSASWTDGAKLLFPSGTDAGKYRWNTEPTPGALSAFTTPL